MGKREEQRANTKRAIVDAFERLCQNSTYVHISVADICAETGISKPTFYRHFQSKEHVILWLSERALDGGVARIGKDLTWRQGYYLTFSIQYEHRALFSDTQSSEVIASLFDFSNQHRLDTLISVIKDLTGSEPTGRLAFQIEALLIMEGVINRRWAAAGMKMPVETLSDYMASTVPRELFDLLENAVSKR